MSRFRRGVRVGAILLIAVAALFALNQLSDTEANVYTPAADIDLSSTGTAAITDYNTTADWLSGESNFHVVVTFSSDQWCIATVSDDCSTVDGSNNPTGAGLVDIGALVGTLTSNTNLALQDTGPTVNTACSNPLTPTFTFQNAVISPANAIANGAAPPGTIAADPVTFPSDAYIPLAADANSDGIPNHVDLWPSYNSTILDDGAGGVVFPKARYSANTIVAGTVVILQFLLFDAGDLTGIPGQPWTDFVGSLGQPSFTILQDPTLTPPSNSIIADFCTPLSTITNILGTTLDNPFTGAINEAGAILHKNSPVPLVVSPGTPSGSGIGNSGTHLYRSITQSERDLDADLIENPFDTCPATPNLDGDPRTFNGTDNDGLDSACDPDAGVQNVDQDGDGWANRLDNCPLVQNGGEVPAGSGNQKPYPDGSVLIQADQDVASGVLVPGGGPFHDGIGVDCDGAPTVPNGHFDQAEDKNFACNGGVDSDDDGWCDDVETFIGTSNGSGCGVNALPPDFDDSGAINVLDRAAIVLAQGAPAPDRHDLNADGSVNVLDRAALVISIGHICP